MSRKSILPYALTALLTLASGCSKDKTSTGPTGSTLTDTEFNSMMDAMDAMGLFFPAGAFGGQPATSTGLALQSSSVPIDYPITCPGGGSGRVQGSITANASGGASGTLTETFSNCKSEGATFTFNTNPNLTMTFTETMNQASGAIGLTFHETGNMNWGTSGKSGGCSIDVNLTMNTNAQTGVATGGITGTMCGRSANQTF